MEPVEHMLLMKVLNSATDGEERTIISQSPLLREKLKNAPSLGELTEAFLEDGRGLTFSLGPITIAVCSYNVPEFRKMNATTAILFVRGDRSSENHRTIYIPSEFVPCLNYAIASLNQDMTISSLIQEQQLQEA